MSALIRIDKMNRILVLNNYSITRVLNEVKNHKKPSHHLYGVMQLKEMGYEIITFDTNVQSVYYKLGRLLSKIPLCNIGDLYLQVKAIQTKASYDFIYAPCQDVTILLGVLNYFSLFKKPIIALAHHPFLKGRFRKLRRYSLYFSTRGHHQFPSLSSQVAAQINLIAKKNISRYLSWGPDLEYYSSVMQLHTNTIKKYDLIAIGRTGRDYLSFVKAISNTTLKVGIYCNRVFKKELDPFISSNIFIQYLESDEDFNYKQIIQLYAQSNILAIPLTNDDSLCGLTSVTDAIGCSMPVLMTYNKYIDLDPQKNNFGDVVEYGNSEEWIRKAYQMLNRMPDFTNSMPKVANDFNVNIFTDQLVKLFQTIK
jgi:hypothetical protein